TGQQDPTTGKAPLIAQADFDPFGARIYANGVPASSPSTDLTLGFIGMNQDDDLGLIHMNGRTYDPSMRHFLSANPQVSRPLNSQTYNRYSYVYNTRVNLTDPSGYAPPDSGGDPPPPIDVVTIDGGRSGNDDNYSLASGATASTRGGHVVEQVASPVH